MGGNVCNQLRLVVLVIFHVPFSIFYFSFQKPTLSPNKFSLFKRKMKNGKWHMENG